MKILKLQMEDGDGIDVIFFDESERIKLKVKGQVCLFLQFLGF